MGSSGKLRTVDVDAALAGGDLNGVTDVIVGPWDNDSTVRRLLVDAPVLLRMGQVCVQSFTTAFPECTCIRFVLEFNLLTGGCDRTRTKFVCLARTAALPQSPADALSSSAPLCCSPDCFCWLGPFTVRLKPTPFPSAAAREPDKCN